MHRGNDIGFGVCREVERCRRGRSGEGNPCVFRSLEVGGSGRESPRRARRVVAEMGATRGRLLSNQDVATYTKKNQLTALEVPRGRSRVSG